MHLLLTVNHRDKMWHGLLIKKGQRVISLRKLAVETGMGIQEIRTVLANTQLTHELTHEKTPNYSIITILNWGLYQTTNTQLTRKLTTNKKDKKKRSILAKAKNTPMIKGYNENSSYEEDRITEDGEKVDSAVDKEIKAKKKNKVNADLVISSFDALYSKEITSEDDKKPRLSPLLVRKMVNEALKYYKADELISYMQPFFENDYYKSTAWAITTFLSLKVLNSLKYATR